MEDKMRNLKYLCSLFVVLAVTRVISLPIKETCIIPPELVKSFSTELSENVKSCRAVDAVDIKYCGDIQNLARDISNCTLGKIWEIKEQREKLINSSRNMPFNEDVDVCMNFANSSSIIEPYRSENEAVSVQLSKDSTFCNDFCTSHPKVCPLLLKLYWVKKTVMEYKNEIDQSNNLLKYSPTQNSDDSKRPSSPNIMTASNQSMKPSKQIHKMVATTESVDNRAAGSGPEKDKPNKDDETRNQKPSTASQDLPKSSANNEASPDKHMISPTSETEKLPTAKNNDDTGKKSTINQQMNDDNIPNTNKNEESKSEQTPINTANTNDASSENTDENIDGVDKKVTDEMNHKTLPKDESKDLPNPIKDNPSESENSPNQEPEKNEKQFGNQPNEFSDEFPDPSNDYSEEELPPTVSKEKPEDKTESDKKLEITIGKGNGMGSVFPEEEDSHFFAYFLTIIVLCIAGYLVFHNKQKIIALIIEGRHERRRRPNGYKRLDTKDSSKSTSQVIF
ncbi:trans-Golgi network integral membrane protein 2-like isoform X2 [Centruroides sculpturatus]|uniref:trans-Golgi network integral membrane protein 2-like isoform X2 n=1 Tax=Centruroides sculpturatus TaxID=218467 RepID=UPI000C6E1ED4|nr:trans-Golgi network integral membrane protein 2-like isoform X2 [Centruroides sculpturatus]